MSEPKREGNLKIVAFEKPDKQGNTNQLGEFIVPFNPNTFTISNKVAYKAAEAKGKDGADPTFENIPPIEFSIEFTIDGVIKPVESINKGKVNVKNAINNNNYVRDEVKELRKVTGCNINGEIHRPNYLTLLWGTIHIDCVLTSLTIVYALFDTDGSPLRAKITCAFLERISSRKSSTQTRLESPDLTKIITVKEGDNLPLIANNKYDDPAYYLQIARINKLKNFRRLAPSGKLILPPMIDSNE
jgi:nucleoid-associated protein YgaU